MSAFSPQPSGFHSRDCVDIVIDAIGDTTVRPIPPHLLPFALAEREKIVKYQGLMNQKKDVESSTQEPDRKNEPK